jgi:hypothetical protein
MGNTHKVLVEKLKDWENLEELGTNVTTVIYKSPAYIYVIGRSRGMNRVQRKN